MSTSFNPYDQWLGIRSSEQPPNHYNLLGIDLFESDAAEIQSAADRRMEHVRQFQSGRHSRLSQQLLTEISQAKLCLLDAEKKAKYDLALHPIKQAAVSTHDPSIRPNAEALSSLPKKRDSVVPKKRTSNMRLTFGIAVAVFGLVAVGLLARSLTIASDIEKRGDSRNASSRLAQNSPQAAVEDVPLRRPPAATKPKIVKDDPALAITDSVKRAPPKETRDKHNEPKAHLEKKDDPEEDPFGEAKQPRPKKPFDNKEEPQPAVSEEPIKSTPDSQELPSLGPHRPDPDKRRPVPAVADAELAKKRIREIYREEYTKAIAKEEERLPLAERLLRDGHEANDDHVGRYALFDESRSWALRSGSSESFALAIDAMSEDYQINKHDLKVEGLKTLADRSSKADENFRKELIGTVIRSAEQAVKDREFEAAISLSRIAKQTARYSNDRNLRDLVSSQNNEVGGMKQYYDAATRAVDQLKQDPQNPDANLMVGRYLCLIAGQWDGGLAFLAKSSDPQLRKAAEMDLSRPVGAAERADTADLWWNLANGYKGLVQNEIRGRAVHWYNQALADLPTLRQKLVEKRIEELAAASKERDDTTPPPDKPIAKTETLREHLLNHKWKITWKKNGVFSDLQFNANGTYQGTSTDYGAIQGMWEIRGNEIHARGKGGASYRYRIVGDLMQGNRYDPKNGKLVLVDIGAGAKQP